MDRGQIANALQVLIHAFGDVGSKRSEDGDESAHHVIHRVVGLHLRDRLLLEPHSRSDQLDVPAGEFIEDERADRSGCPVKVADLHLFGDLFGKRVHAGDEPAVFSAEFRDMVFDRRRIPDTVFFRRLVAVERHVRHRELVDIPENVEHPVVRLDAFKRETHVIPRSICRQDVLAHNVHAELFGDVFRGDDVSKAFAHLLSVCIQSESVHENGFVRRFAECDRG